MTWTVAASSSGVAYAASTITTVITSTANGTFVFAIDMSAMTPGDLFSVRLFSSAFTTSLVQAWKGTWQHAQVNGLKISPPIASDTVFSATFESVAGSITETFPWKLLSI